MIWLHRCYDIQFLESPDIIGMDILDVLDRISEILSSGSFFRFLVHVECHADRTICDTMKSDLQASLICRRDLLLHLHSRPERKFLSTGVRAVCIRLQEQSGISLRHSINKAL